MPKWRERLRYAFDNLVSRGTGAMVAALASLSLAIIIISGTIVAVTGVHPIGESPVGFVEGAWLALMRTLDPGTMGADTGWGFRLVMFATTIGGILIISTLIGVLANGIQNKIEDLRRGRSRVIEQGHTIILGWTEQIFTIIPELIEANANQPSSCIVILGELDKVEMEQQFRQRIGRHGNTRIVCRTGNALEFTDLYMANPNDSKSIIVLSPESEDPDSEVIKTALALIHLPERRTALFHIVAELRDIKNLEAARVVGQDEVEWVVVNDFVARVIAQTCHQSGLSVIYTDLLDFAGDEIYFHSEPTLVGCTYREALSAFERNALLGLYTQGASCRLNPPMDTLIEPGDQLVLLAEDDDRIFPSAGTPSAAEEHRITGATPAPPAAVKLLILGWNALGPAVIRELACYLPAGSQVMIVAAVDDVTDALERECPEPSRKTLQVTFQLGDTTDRRTLDSIAPGDYDHIVVLCYSDHFSHQKADAQTLITLLHLRDLANQHQYRYSLVSQMMDVRNRNLAAMTRADDFIVSDRLISLMMTQIAENKGLNAVFADLFNPQGSEIYLKPIEDYITPGEPLHFYTLIEAAARVNQTAIGYRLRAQAQDEAASYGIHLNPAKRQRVTYAPGDCLIVLAES